MLNKIKVVLKQVLSKRALAVSRKIYQKALLPFYLGNRYYCPCCKTNLRYLLPYWGISNARCPRCNSIARYRLQWLFLEQKTEMLSSDLSVLHFAPESALHRNLSRLPNIEYITGDLLVTFMDLLCIRPDNVIDICNIHYPDGYFDVVICNHVLEHVIDDKKAMNEIYRVLKSGGWAILQVPINKNIEKTLEDKNINTPEKRFEIYGNDDHYRLYGRDYGKRLESSGFEVKIIPFLKEFSKSQLDKYRLITDEEDIYLAMKN